MRNFVDSPVPLLANAYEENPSDLDIVVSLEEANGKTYLALLTALTEWLR